MIKNVSLFLVVIGVMALAPFLTDKIIQGQIIKQTIVAHTAASFAEGKTEGIFPKRFYLEPYHQDVVPWAEEFPIYAAVIGYVYNQTKIPIPIIGKIYSLIALIFLIIAGFHIGEIIERSSQFKNMRYILPVIITFFPVFRIYSVSIMPDLAMTAALAWAILFALRKNWAYSALLIAIASLYKYYALFTGLGITFYFLLQAKENKIASNEILKNLALFFISTLPCIFYLWFFTDIGINNPITEYRAISGSGHLGTADSLFSLDFISRLFTWIFIKNSSIIGGLIAIFGFLLFLKKKSDNQITNLIIALLLTNALFIIVFSKTVYIHDYYSLQIALIIAILSSMGFSFILSKSKITAIILTALFISTSVYRNYRALIPLNFLEGAANVISQEINENEMGLLISDKAPEAIIHLSKRTAWVHTPNEWGSRDYIQKFLNERLVDKRITWLGVLLTGNNTDSGFESQFEKLKMSGWNKVISKHDFQSNNKKVPTAKLWIIRKEGQQNAN